MNRASRRVAYCLAPIGSSGSLSSDGALSSWDNVLQLFDNFILWQQLTLALYCHCGFIGK
jgi:hypothetical protein